MLIAALKAWKDPSIYTLSYLIIISLFKNLFFFCHSKCFLGDVLDNYVQKFEKIFLQKKKKNVFLPWNAYIHFNLSFLLFGK